MAKKLYAAIALVNITHNAKQYKIGETLRVNEDESQELCDANFIEMTEKITKEVTPPGEGGDK